MEGTVALPTVNPGIPLAIVVIIAHPGIEAAAPVGVSDKHRGPTIALLKAAQMPLAKVSGIKIVVIEDIRHGRHTLRQRVLVAGHALVRIPAGQQRPAEGTAQGKARDGPLVVLPLGRQPIQMGCVEIGVTVAAQGLCPVLITENPNGILVLEGIGHCVSFSIGDPEGDVPSGTSPSGSYIW